MTKNSAKIKHGLQVLTGKSFEIMSGTVVAGSIDTDQYTISVLPTDGTAAIEGVMLGAVTASNGVVLIPKDDSSVIIGSIDGPGEWTLLKASELQKAIVTVGNVVCEIDDTQVNMQNSNVVFNIGSSAFKMNTASESLFGLLQDLLTGLTLLTVGTSTGPSTVPVNVATFNDLLTRLNNLLSA